VLVFRPQPAHLAARFFRRTFGVQRDQAHEQGFAGGVFLLRVGERGGEVAPAVGVEHGGVEFVVQGLQHADQALLVDGFFLGAERFAAAQFFEHVVHAGQRQRGVGFLLALAVGVELFGEVADAGGLLFGGGGEGEGLEAAGFVVARAVFRVGRRQPVPRRMDAAR
jgi:hypothetical protein